MGIADGFLPIGGVLRVCGKDQARFKIARRLLLRHGHSLKGQGLGRQQTTSHYGINLCVREMSRDLKRVTVRIRPGKCTKQVRFG